MAAETETVETKTPDVREDLKALRRDLDALRTDLRGLVRTAGAKTADQLAAAKDRLAEAARGVDQRVRETYDAALDRGEEAATLARGEVIKRPLTSIAVALGVGLLVGRFFIPRR